MCSLLVVTGISLFFRRSVSEFFYNVFMEQS